MFTWSSSFVSGFWKELFKLQDSQLKMSTAYHSQKDGQTKIINHCLETFLCCFIAYQPKLWVLWVPQAEYWYDTTFHVSTGTTPFEAVYDPASNAHLFPHWQDQSGGSATGVD